VKTLVAIGANYHYDCGLNHQIFDGEVEEEAKDKFAARTGQPRELLVEIIHKAHKVWASEPRLTKSQLKKIKCPTLVLAGDDEPFSTDHTVSLYESIPNAQLAIVPGTSHAVLKEKPRVIKQILQDFYRDPSFPITLNPNRRLKETLRIRG
jgi:pimeloyl-ACP methyl ester carboxylesterase